MIKTADGTEIYENQIESIFVQSFMDNGINPYKDKIEHERANGAFIDVYEALFMPDENTLRVNNRASKLDYSDIYTLEKIAHIFIKLCNKCNITPWLYMYSSLTGICEDTLNTWEKGEYRGYIYYDLDGNEIQNINTWRMANKGEYTKKVTTRYSELVKNIKKATTNAKKGRLSDSDIGNITQANNDEEVGLLYAIKEARAKAEIASRKPELGKTELLKIEAAEGPEADF